MLDFGCGAGRTLRHFLPEAESGEFWGTDIDAPSIDWIQENLCPPLHAWRCEPTPPLGLELDSFDLVYAISVFTHLTTASSAWLLELHRLLKPGGILIATYIGRWSSEFFAGEPWDEDRVGKNVLYHTRSWEDGGPAVLMSDWWVREHWGRAFEILEIAPQIHNMSWAVMRKKGVELSDDEIDRPSNDPREVEAMRHNLRQVQREVEQLTEELSTERNRCAAQQQQERAQREAEVSQLRRHYEGSRSWKVTRPMRAAIKAVRGRGRPE